MQFSTGGSLRRQVEIMKPSDTVVSTSTHWRCGGFRPGVRHSENTAAFPDPRPKWPIPTIRFLLSVLIWCRRHLSFADKPAEPQSQGAKDPREVQLDTGKNAYGRSDDFLLEVLWHRGPCAVVVSEERSGKNNTTAAPGFWPGPNPL